jgi:hypothetical protein
MAGLRRPEIINEWRAASACGAELRGEKKISASVMFIASLQWLSEEGSDVVTAAAEYSPDQHA